MTLAQVLSFQLSPHTPAKRAVIFAAGDAASGNYTDIPYAVVNVGTAATTLVFRHVNDAVDITISIPVGGKWTGWIKSITSNTGANVALLYDN